MTSNRSTDSEDAKDLTVCDIMGDWGRYQWSVCLFAICYSALLSVTVVVGPIWTPDMNHLCARGPLNQSLDISDLKDAGEIYDFTSKNQHECTRIERTKSNASENIIEKVVECEYFVYNDTGIGKVLTNTFDLVCGHEWLRSFLSSSALAGMLLSSVTLGQLSDKCGRLYCIEVASALSILATIGAIVSHNYFFLNICFLIMSFAQVGAGNALCTLVMEATSPRFRFVPVFEYGVGWGLGVLLVPFIHNWTLNYQHFLFVMLAWQLVMLPWMHWGVFESIRWLLSEGKINRAQIELRRACRINGVKSSTKVANEIAIIQAQQVRKASRIIEDEDAAQKLARALERRVNSTQEELDMLSAAIKRSFFGDSELPDIIDMQGRQHSDHTPPAGQSIDLSPSLRRASFALPADPQSMMTEPVDEVTAQINNLQRASKTSLTTQGLITLAMRYRKALQKEDEGRFFLIQMFHPKLWKKTTLLMLVSIMLETSYYGLIQANKFVGDNVALNYVMGALSDILAASVYMVILWLFSRQVAIIMPVLVGALACLGMAASYHLTLNEGGAGEFATPLPLDLSDVRLNQFKDQVDSVVIANENITALIDTTTMATNSSQLIDIASAFLGLDHLTVELREQINFWLMSIGKLAITVAIQVASTIAMEIYPNNLRQTGPGVIVFCGRIGSILSPFLFNDPTPEKWILKGTLVGLSITGALICIMTPFFIKNSKSEELCDHMDEIDDHKTK